MMCMVDYRTNPCSYGNNIEQKCIHNKDAWDDRLVYLP